MNNLWKVLSYIGFSASAINLAIQVQMWAKAGKAPSQDEATTAVGPVLASFATSFGVDVPMDKAMVALAAAVTVFQE